MEAVARQPEGRAGCEGVGVRTSWWRASGSEHRADGQGHPGRGVGAPGLQGSWAPGHAAVPSTSFIPTLASPTQDIFEDSGSDVEPLLVREVF